MTTTPHILYIEDERAVIDLVRTALKMSGYDLTGATSGTEGLTLMRQQKPDLVLLDLWLPDTHGFGGLIELRRCYPKLPIVVVSAFADPNVVEKTLVCGAAGFISKATARTDLVSAVSSAIAGDVVVPSELLGLDASAGAELKSLTKRLRSLTRQQLRVLEMLCQGLLNKQIAYELEVGETTVKAHVSEILRKLSVTSRTQAVLEVSKLDFGAVLALYDGENGDGGISTGQAVASAVAV